MNLIDEIFDSLSDSDSPVTDEQIQRMKDEIGLSMIDGSMKLKDLRFIHSTFEGHVGRIGQVGGSLPAGNEHQDTTSENPHIKAGRFLMEVQNPDAQDTEQAYKKDGQWTQERVDKVHASALARIREGVVKATGKPTVYMTGGGTASGKSTLLQKYPELLGFPPKGNAIVADPDEMKKECPEYRRCANPSSEHFFNGAASLVHEESSYLGKKAVMDGIKDGYNVVYDTTGDSGITKLEQKVAQMREAGAGRVEGHYAFPGSVEEAYRRSMERFDHAKDGLKRYVDPEVIKASHRDVASTWINAARKGTFDKLTLWSTAVEKGQPPVLIASAEKGNIKVHDENLFNKFRMVGGI